MMGKKIIACLDIKDGRIVKGVNFEGLRDAGDPVQAAAKYSNQGADELVVLDITATGEGRKTSLENLKKIAQAIDIPLCFGGGINKLGDFEPLFAAGADKLSIGSAAVKNPELISQAAKEFGSEKIVCAIDAKSRGQSWQVFIGGGKEATGLDAIEWAVQAANLGAGEILLTGMDSDGCKEGYDLELTRAVAKKVSVPVIASGGAGKMEDFYKALTYGKAQGALAASLFHFDQIRIADLKEYLRKRGIKF
ncbi:MAG: imidazole glycerol phosphate synthase subunit HisF [Clostridiales bacterium]|nr:imidazole glycerol phosphate synthase subunit HisF [Clostridiales bacterium]